MKEKLEDLIDLGMSYLDAKMFIKSIYFEGCDDAIGVNKPFDEEIERTFEGKLL